MFNVPTWSLIKNVYNFVDAGSNRLLITVGDSWTWGDSLGKTKVRNGVDDTDYRLTHIYGKVMQQRLTCNWINIALPGGSNSLVLDWLNQILLETLHYKEVIVVITLTESGRHEELQLCESYSTQQYALTQILASTYNKINILKKIFNRYNFIVGHNFTDGASGLIPLLEYSWLEVMLNKQIQKNTHIVVSEHIEQMNYHKRFPDVLEVMNRAMDRINLMDQCEYCNREDSRHPNEKGHAMWAEYILGNI